MFVLSAQSYRLSLLLIKVAGTVGKRAVTVFLIAKLSLTVENAAETVVTIQIEASIDPQIVERDINTKTREKLL